MNSCKDIHLQAKYIRETCSSACGRGGGGRVKRSSNGKDIDARISLVMSMALKINKKSKSKSSYDSDLED